MVTSGRLATMRVRSEIEDVLRRLVRDLSLDEA